MAAPPPMTMKRTWWRNSNGRNSRKFGPMTSPRLPGLAPGLPQFVDVFHEAFEFLKALGRGQFQVLAQQRPVHVLLVGFNHRVAVIGRGQFSDGRGHGRVLGSGKGSFTPDTCSTRSDVAASFPTCRF